MSARSSRSTSAPIRRNAAPLLRALDGAELWAVVKADGYGHGAVDVARAALEAGRRRSASRPSPRRSSCARLPRRAHPRHGPDARPARSREARDAELELVVCGRRDPGGRPRPSEARHGHGPLGALRAARADRATSSALMSHLATADVGPRLRARCRSSASDEATGRSRTLDRATSRTAPPRCGFPEAALRRGPLRDRALRHLAVRRRPGGRRARACAPLGVAPRAREAARAGGEHRLRAALRRRAADLDRDRPRRLRGRLPARPDRHRGARRRRARAASSARSRWTRSRSSSTRELPAGHAGDARSATACSSRITRASRTRSATRSSDRARLEPDRGRGGWCSDDVHDGASRDARRRGGVDRRRRGSRRAARAAASSTSTSPAAIPSEAARALRATGPAARRSRSPSGTAPGASRSTDGRDRRLHAARRRDRGRPRDTRLHDQRDRRAARGRRAGRPVRRARRSRGRRRARGLGRASSRTTRCGCCAPCGSRTSSASGWIRAHGALVRAHRRRSSTRPAGERILGELRRLSAAGLRASRRARAARSRSAARSTGRVDARRRSGLPARRRLRRAAARRFPISNELARYARALLRAREPGAVAARDPSLPPADRAVGARRARVRRRAGARRALVEAARLAEPAEPLLRGDELGLPPGPEIGRILEAIDEERAAGTISTREEALALARKLAEEGAE